MCFQLRKSSKALTFSHSPSRFLVPGNWKLIFSFIKNFPFVFLFFLKKKIISSFHFGTNHHCKLEKNPDSLHLNKTFLCNSDFSEMRKRSMSVYNICLTKDTVNFLKHKSWVFFFFLFSKKCRGHQFLTNSLGFFLRKSAWIFWLDSPSKLSGRGCSCLT